MAKIIEAYLLGIKERGCPVVLSIEVKALDKLGITISEDALRLRCEKLDIKTL